MSDDQYDQFGDITQKETGIFGTDTASMNNALHKHDTAQTTVLADGVHTTFECPVCGSSREITAEWPEVVCLSMNVGPDQVIQGMTPWVFTAQGWCPVGIRCSACVTPQDLRIYMTQQEAAGHVRHGESQGLPYFRARPGQPGSFYQVLVGHVRARLQQPR
jgi:hypothetical protein